MIKHTLLILVLSYILLSMSACSSRQELYISGTGDGTLSIDVHLDDMVVRYFRDLLGGFSGRDSNDISLFDTKKISETISGLPGVDLMDIGSESADILHLEMDFRNPAMIFENPEAQGVPPIISFSTVVSSGKNRRRLELYLSKDNLITATALLGLSGSDILDTFGPQENPYSEDEYLDLMGYLFEEYESLVKIRSIVKSSEIIINLKVNGHIIDCDGCTIADSDSMTVIKIPLLDIVTLEKPIEIVVEWE